MGTMEVVATLEFEEALDEVVGASHVEHMLDIIFREFCIGK